MSSLVEQLGRIPIGNGWGEEMEAVSKDQQLFPTEEEEKEKIKGEKAKK